MSTVGKVLIVLVALSLLGWIFLASLVAEHHANWTKRLNDVKAEVAAVQAELPPLSEAIDRNKAETTLMQVGLDRLRRNFRAELSLAQKAETETKEALSRFQIQLDQVKKQIVAAKQREAIRTQEVADLNEAIKKEQALVQEMIAKNKTSREELFALRKTFMNTLAENKNYLQRLMKASSGSSASTKPRVRLGSLVR